uniref:Enoyl reductase (ER) domain-containing protein n=1 Tax=Lotharella globosa TaxID=91324 RepID=A0A7S3YBV5_9EUKA
MFRFHCAQALTHVALQVLKAIKDVKVIIISKSGGYTYKEYGSFIVRVVDPSMESTVDCVMQETGGLGLDLILDFRDNDQGFGGTVGDGKGDKAETDPQDDRKHLDHREKIEEEVVGRMDTPCPVKKSVIIRCLAVHGRWITSNTHLQLHPHESLQLAMRSASLCFLFEQTWLLSPKQQGKYLHILEDLMQGLKKKVLKPLVAKRIKLEEVRSALKHLRVSSGGGKIAVLVNNGDEA